MSDPEFSKTLLIGGMPFRTAGGGVVMLKIYAVNNGTVLVELAPDPATDREPGLMLACDPASGFMIADLVARAAEAAADAVGDPACTNCGEHHDDDDDEQLALLTETELDEALKRLVEDEAGGGGEH